jgi:hypothetical protein
MRGHPAAVKKQSRSPIVHRHEFRNKNRFPAMSSVTIVQDPRRMRERCVAARATLSIRCQVFHEAFNSCRAADLAGCGKTILARCSKRPDFSPAQPWRAETRLVPNKAAASEDRRRYKPHFVWAVRPCNGSWRTEKPLSDPDFRDSSLRI